MDMKEFSIRLEAYLAGVREKINAVYAKNYPNLTPPTVEINDGMRYVKVITVGSGSRSVHTFVDKTNGNILKAASWKKVEPKNPRGNLFDSDFGLSGVTDHGAVYLI